MKGRAYRCLHYCVAPRTLSVHWGVPCPLRLITSSDESKQLGWALQDFLFRRACKDSSLWILTQFNPLLLRSPWSSISVALESQKTMNLLVIDLQVADL